MSWALPLPAAIPLIAAALLVATGHVAPRRVQDGVALVAATAATGFAALILAASQDGTVLHWFGGWQPRSGIAVGVAFVADPLGAGMAVMATGVATMVLVYSWTYMLDAPPTYNVLVLTFTAGMAGFSLTGDIFNMFVWFELMGVSAYVLAGYTIEDLGPLQGALNFAVTNTVGGYMMLLGIGLLYARTGALNLAQIGSALTGRRADTLVVVAFVLLVAGLMAKAAIVPFHFWLADAYAAAPAPVCALLAGAMAELGLLFIARVYWTVFAGPMHADAHAVTVVLVVFGAVTALLGAVMCLLQRHVKRLLAYSTISQSGVMLTGIALLDPRSLGGVAGLVLAHGLLKSGLFLVSGVILLQLGHIDELRLHGAGRAARWAAVLWFAGTAGLVGIPYAGEFLGHQLMDAGAGERGYAFLAAVAMVAAGLSGGAMLRAGARIFLGWGPAEDPLLSEEPDESPSRRAASLRLMTGVSAVAIVLGLAVSVAPGLPQRAELAAQRFTDRPAYAARVLHSVHPPAAPRPSFGLLPVDDTALLNGAGAVAIALAAAAFGLWHGRLPRRVVRAGVRTLGTPVELVRAAHSGIVGDYLLWLCAGTVVLAAAWLAAI
jgi:multicomponent Na+:H+ antiporter subunit D